MKRVILESPFKGDVALNIAYARACVADCLRFGESASVSHLVFTQPGILDDNIPEERQLGIDAGLAWRHVSDGSVAYIDLGVSSGMKYGLALAADSGKSTEERRLPAEAMAQVHVEAQRIRESGQLWPLALLLAA